MKMNAKILSCDTIELQCLKRGLGEIQNTTKHASLPTTTPGG